MILNIFDSIKQILLKTRYELTVGALTLVGLVALILGYNYLRGNNLLSRSDYYNINFSNTLGLYKSNAVVISGVNIGKVTEVKLSDDPKYQNIVTISLNDGLVLPEDSKFKIISVDILGTKAIAIERGNSKNLLSENKIYNGEAATDMIAEITSQVLPLKDKAVALMSTMDTMMKDVHAAIGSGEQNNLKIAMNEVSATLKSANKLLADISQMVSAEKSNIQSLIQNTDGVMANANVITKKLADNSQRIDSILANIEKFSGNVSKINLEETVNAAKNTLTEVNNLLMAVNNGEGTLGKIAKDEGLYTKIDSTIASLNSLLIDFQKNPKRYVSFSLIERKEKP